MAGTAHTLHGSAPDTCPVALLLVDVINPLDFPEAERLLRTAIPAGEKLADLKGRARSAGVPVVYANDNFGRWRSDLSAVVEECRKAKCRGRPLVELLHPAEDDYFVLKPKHSAFFSTTMDTLLRHLGTRVIVLGGFATDICVLFTANDAYMRDFQLVIPSDGVAANDPGESEVVLNLMRRVLKAETPRSDAIDFPSLVQRIK